MGAVIDMRTRETRKNPSPAEIFAANKQGGQYSCGRCRAESFKLFGGGVIRCAECDVVVANLMLVSVRPPDGTRKGGAA